MKQEKKNKPKYLKLYYRWMGNGLPERGLCNSLGADSLFDLIKATVDERIEVKKEGGCAVCWGSGESGALSIDHFYVFTPLRQTIVLLMAALNNEL